MEKPSARPFLTAEWRRLVMLSYSIDPAILEPYLPSGCQLDYFQGETFVSVVGFLFQNTRVAGFSIPRHRDFAEINLRFYVTPTHDPARRGVVFIKEICPRRMVTWVARRVYNENYVTLPMRYRATHPLIERGTTLGYEWRHNGRWCQLSATSAESLAVPSAGTLDEFIAEHYWGYTRTRSGHTAEYPVRHVAWRVAKASFATLDSDVARLYGPQFVSALAAEPVSAFLCEGSPVEVYRGRLLTQTAEIDRCSTSPLLVRGM